MTDPADPYRPTDRRGFQLEAARLRRDGLTADDIAACLRLTRNAVADLLFEYDHRGEPRHGTAVTGHQRPPQPKEKKP